MAGFPTIWPDYRSDIDGASIGRALFPGPYSPKGLGEAAKFVRPALTTGMAKNPLPFWMLGGMGIDEAWLAGPALVGALLEAGLRNGVDVRVEAPAVRLVTDESGVRGVVVKADGVEHTVRATKGVVLASGGFESSTELTTEHLDAPFGTQVSPKGHDGIAVQLAEEIGADLTGMQDAWWMPGVQLPGEELEGRPLSRVFLGERALPHSIMVNSQGRALRQRGPGLRPVRRHHARGRPGNRRHAQRHRVARLRPDLLEQVRHLRHHPRRRGAGLPPPRRHPVGARE